MLITNLGKLVLQIGAALFYYKLWQLLQIREAVVTNWENIYYKLRMTFQIRAIITNWSITDDDKDIIEQGSNGPYLLS